MVTQTKERPMKNDIYQRVTDTIIAELEKGTAPWTKPWAGANMTSIHKNVRGNAYSGVNVLLTWISAVNNGFTETQWLTFKQAKELGGSVRKGEKGTRIVFAKNVQTDKENADGKKIGYFMHKGYTVFNICQCEGLPESMYDTATEPVAEPVRCVETESLIAKTGAMIQTGSSACYSPSSDTITMPPAGLFADMPQYYATLLHELTHWTGHKSRLDREKHKRCGDATYAFEELIAELGAAFLCAQQGIKGELQHASYIESWLKALKNDNRFVFKAASAASKAHQFINDLADNADVKVAA